MIVSFFIVNKTVYFNFMCVALIEKQATNIEVQDFQFTLANCLVSNVLFNWPSTSFSTKGFMTGIC
jgi:hypothetical protein